MPAVGIVTDSTSCIPAEFVREYGIRIVPVGVVIDRKPYRDTDLTSEQFWKMFYAAKEPTTTSAVNPADFMDAFADLGQQTGNIVCITVSGALSATYQIARKAREMVQAEKPDLNIEIIDSNTSTGAMGFIVMEAARAAGAGKSLPEVVQAARILFPKVKFLVGLNTLKYLIRIGRAPKTAVIGEAFGVKPIIGMVNNTGLVESLGRARGIDKCMQKMADMVKDYIDAAKPVHMMVHYSDDIQAGEKLKKLVTDRYNCGELYLTPYTPVMASASGPAIALSFYTD